MLFFTLFLINLIDKKTRATFILWVECVFISLSRFLFIFWYVVFHFPLAAHEHRCAVCAHYNNNNNNHHNVEPNEVYVLPKWILHRYFRFIKFMRANIRNVC